MPCRSDYLEATGKENGLRRAAKLAVFVATNLGVPLSASIAENADKYYAEDKGQVQWLCGKITKMTDEQRERIIYNAHDATSRDLANWWEEHQAADKARIEREEAAAQAAALRESAVSKLTPEEQRALRL